MEDTTTARSVRRLNDREVTDVLHRVCILDQPIKVVAKRYGVHKRTVAAWVRRYEERE